MISGRISSLLSGQTLLFAAALSLALLLLADLPGHAQTNAAQSAQIPARHEKFQLYLLMGQSNMAGRGEIGPEDLTTHPRVFVLATNDVWEIAVEPITRDRKSGLGVGPGFTFAKVMADKNPGVAIGLIPCAVGGTPLNRWQKGADLYERALARARIAMKDGTLTGVLWHQGENDSTAPAFANSYGQRLAQMIADFRADLGLKSLPFVVGKLGEFLYTRGEGKTPLARVVNNALEQLPAAVPFTACVDSHGLTHKGDEVHFNSASQHEFGRRYAEAMLRLQAAGGK